MESKLRLELLKPMKAAYVHAISQTPEEDAQKKILEWAKNHGLNKKPGARLFGRNTYSTDKPEPHGYEYYLTVEGDIMPEEDIGVREIPGGSYVAFRVHNLSDLTEGWKKFWALIELSDYKHVGVTKGEKGWVNGFEEHINWQEEKPPQEWIFDLWVQLKQ